MNYQFVAFVSFIVTSIVIALATQAYRIYQAAKKDAYDRKTNDIHQEWVGKYTAIRIPEEDLRRLAELNWN
jgi:hypothetical protein